MIDRDSYERLYLVRDDKQDIYIDLPQLLPQHQLDGIRYLYRQFKKRNPGVILNDPSGYGKCLQVVLFVHAMRPTLNKPILILCDDNAVQNWKEHFEIWTNCFHEVAVRTSNPFAKNSIYINSKKDGASFSRRTWGMVVVHDNHIAKEMLQINFNADYKIWVTSMNLKEELHKLSLIYQWLHPNSEINLDNFKTEPKDYLDMLTKSLLLDAYLEDFLIRRNDFCPLFVKPQVHEIIESPVVESTKVSRKNKDPTGTKVKSTKKRRLDNEVANQEALEQKVPSIHNNDTNTYDVSNEMFNFTNNTEGNFCKGTMKYIHDNNLPENAFKTEDTEESFTLEFQNAVNELVQADNASQHEGNTNNSEMNVIINEVNDNITNLNYSQSDTQKLSNSDEFDIPMIEVNAVVPIQTLKDGIRDNTSTIKINTSAKSDKMKYVDVSIDSGKVKNHVEECSNNKQKSNNVSDTTESDDELKVPETVKVDEDISIVHCKPGDNNANNKNATKTEDSNVPEAKSEESDDVERKLLELEKQVLDQFKGSLLDRML
ncbi:uncharacterized protein LOC113240052 [Hyposmocoma kahamanoa]|uniref:uncharacterized protein LOC113240052 n=1 Tax=Hyposmocoma kahamanoa TaxID=1477025 RepID=UPI000E6D665F|nr:uncharacterized protein LOC113240052 [Hyposmocoma kahamanoa]